MTFSRYESFSKEVLCFNCWIFSVDALIVKIEHVKLEKMEPEDSKKCLHTPFISVLMQKEPQIFFMKTFQKLTTCGGRLRDGSLGKK